ncbi:MAG: TIGR04086 family membrane protein [Solirubrobacterales bacterium]
MEKKLCISVLEGVLRGFIITVVMLLIFAVIMTFWDIQDSTCSLFYLVVTMISIIYGSMHAVMRIRKKGWLTGFMVALIYMLVLYTVSVISGNPSVIGIDRLERLGLALATGTMAGMLTINL